jgi:hypothetical protein
MNISVKFAFHDLAIHSTLVNDFYLTPAMAASLERYYILHWSPEYLRQQLGDSNRIIHHQDVDYIPVLPQKMIAATDNVSWQFRLSFRKPHTSSGIPPYVLVRLL